MALLGRMSVGKQRLTLCGCRGEGTWRRSDRRRRRTSGTRQRTYRNLPAMAGRSMHRTSASQTSSTCVTGTEPDSGVVRQQLLLRHQLRHDVLLQVMRIEDEVLLPCHRRGLRLQKIVDLVEQDQETVAHVEICVPERVIDVERRPAGLVDGVFEPGGVLLERRARHHACCRCG